MGSCLIIAGALLLALTRRRPAIAAD